MTAFWRGFLLGGVALLFVKYAVVGVDRWNAQFHPTRRES